MTETKVQLSSLGKHGGVRATFDVLRRPPMETFEGDVPADRGLRSVTICTEQPVRRGGGVAIAAGAVLEHYMKNPVVMWAHDYAAPPVARCVGLTVEPGVGINASFEFPAPGVYGLADTIRQLWDAGFINAASIGFNPLTWKWQKGQTQEGVEEFPMFETWELYEFSLVSIPRDRDALRRAVEVLSLRQSTEAGPDSSNPFNRFPESVDSILAAGTTALGGPIKPVSSNGANGPVPQLDLLSVYLSLRALREVL